MYVWPLGSITFVAVRPPCESVSLIRVDKLHHAAIGILLLGDVAIGIIGPIGIDNATLIAGGEQLIVIDRSEPEISLFASLYAELIRS